MRSNTVLLCLWITALGIAGVSLGFGAGTGSLAVLPPQRLGLAGALCATGLAVSVPAFCLTFLLWAVSITASQRAKRNFY